MSDKQSKYIGDLGEDELSPKGRVLGLLLLAVLGALVGFLVAFLIRGILALVHLLTNLIWAPTVQAGQSLFFLPVLICTIGGLIIGLWNRKFDTAPQSLAVVLGTCKKTGGYRLKGGVSAVISFALPLVFGGSVGPEAGLAGIIAHGCCWVRDVLKRSGIKARTAPDVTISAVLTAVFATPLLGIVACIEDALQSKNNIARNDAELGSYEFRRGIKIALYCIAALGSFAGLKVFELLTGGSVGLPRFTSIDAGFGDYRWFFACTLAAYALAWIYHLSARGFTGASKMIGDHPVLKSALCGVVLGAVVLVLPLTLFSGEEQSYDLMATWEMYPAWLLLVTAVAKAIATPLCHEFGWKGGHLFPCIFTGVACGYGLALVSGTDPMFMVTVTATCFVAGVMRRPLLALSVVLLCFPANGILWMVLAALVGAVLPIPTSISGIEQGGMGNRIKARRSKHEITAPNEQKH